MRQNNGKFSSTFYTENRYKFRIMLISAVCHIKKSIDQDQVLTTWSEGRQNGLVLNSRLCDVTALQSSKSDINIQ